MGQRSIKKSRRCIYFNRINNRRIILFILPKHIITSLPNVSFYKFAKLYISWNYAIFGNISKYNKLHRLTTKWYKILRITYNRNKLSIIHSKQNTWNELHVYIKKLSKYSCRNNLQLNRKILFVCNDTNTSNRSILCYILFKIFNK